MNKVLIVNHSKENCGVQQFGKRVASIVSKSDKVDYTYIEVDSYKDFIDRFKEVKPDYILYNWYPVTMGWLEESFIPENPDIQHYFIHHDGNIRQNYDKYIYFGADDVFDANHATNLPIPVEKKVVLPRPLFVYEGDYPVKEVFTVGSFGFGFHHKGFDSITSLVNEELAGRFPIKLRFHMPFAHYGDPDGKVARSIAADCERLNTNTMVELEITHDFRTDEGVLEFLAGNDINVFHYNAHPNHGISSVLDYALSVDVSIALSNNTMFRHVLIDEINLDYRSILEIYEAGTEPLDRFYKSWTQKKLIKGMEELFV